MENKQTAVEWLVEQLYLNRQYITYEESTAFEKAKAMEKQQQIEFAEFVASYTDKNKNANGEMLHAKSKYDEAERTIDLLEQYYNKNFNK